MIWPRDLKGERAAEARLLGTGMHLVSKVIPASLLDEATRHSVVPARPFPSPEIAWIEWLDGPESGKLRAEGWTLEVDPGCGLIARNVADFIPAIEAESDHGIEWFRFDVSYEIDGKRFSLIPVIAEAIAKDSPPADSPDLPEPVFLPCENPADGFIRFPARRLLEIVGQGRPLFAGGRGGGRSHRELGRQG